MIESVTIFLAIIIFFVAIGYSVCGLVVGILPTKGAETSANYIVWGNKDVDPYMLKGIRARLLSLVLVIIFVAICIPLFSMNILIKNMLISNVVSIVIGLIIGSVLYNKMYHV